MYGPTGELDYIATWLKEGEHKPDCAVIIASYQNLLGRIEATAGEHTERLYRLKVGTDQHN